MNKAVYFIDLKLYADPKTYQKNGITEKEFKVIGENESYIVIDNF